MKNSYDVIVMGAGHNGLIAANYCAQAGKNVLVLEARSEVGGATASVRAFPEYDANLSRYSYLVSLLPEQILKDLKLNFTTLSRRVSSYTPYSKAGKDAGLYIARTFDEASAASFRALTGDDAEAQAWQRFYGEIATVMERIAPSLLEKLPTRSELRARAGNDEVWNYLFERPLGEILNERFSDDLVKGVILTDGLVGTYTSAFDLQSNICFLYHLIGNGTGEWKVPQGGMGAIVTELLRISALNGVTISTNARVTEIDADDRGVSVVTSDGDRYNAQHLVVGAAAAELHHLMGWPQPESLDGAQMKINILLNRLPRLKSGDDPRDAFAGTFHINESFSQFEKVFQETQSGKVPEFLPAEMYCHTLTDASILSPELAAAGYQTLTLFGFHTPAFLFDDKNEAVREKFLTMALDGLDQYLAEPIRDVIARNSDGSLAIEAKTPLDLEDEISLPRGNIFHHDLTFPMKEVGENITWGVETQHPRILLCGASARRGGGVSGISGHNAAMAILKR